MSNARAFFHSLAGSKAIITGGVITTNGIYTIHTFNTSGTFFSSVPLNIEYLIVAGGGAGGGTGAFGTSGSGGGAGGPLNVSAYITPGSYAAVVGAGGVGVAGSANGNSGGNSSFYGTIRHGGGGGVAFGQGLSGGSGGGSTYNDGAAVAGGSGIDGEGYAGGGNPGGEAGSGGGGAGSPGVATSALAVGNGGDGVLINTFGLNSYFAGGGGGGGNANVSAFTGGVGGSGVGGDGGSGTTLNAPGLPGMANTGSGGGGAYEKAGSGADQPGGNGADGVIIVRYITASVPSIRYNFVGCGNSYLVIGTPGIIAGIVATAPYSTNGSVGTNKGVSSQTTAQMQTLINSQAFNYYSPGNKNVLIFVEGHNDLLNNGSPSGAITRTSAYCAAVRAQGFKIIVPTLIYWDPSISPVNVSNANVDAYNAALLALVGVYDGVIRPELDPVFATTVSSGYGPDKYHPSQIGINKYAELFVAATNALIW